MGKLLNICVLTYNRPVFLRECLKSILAQTFTNFHVIVLDNASEENVRDVVNKFPDPRVTYFRQPKNIGGTGNFESALRDHSHSKYLTIFHDDDIMPPTLLEHQVRVLEQNPTFAFAATQYLPFRGKVPVLSNEYAEPCSIFHSAHELVYAILKGLQLDFCSTMYRSSIASISSLDHFHRCGPVGDRPFMVDVCGSHGCVVLHAPRVLRRLHTEQDSNSRSTNTEHIEELYTFYLQHMSPLNSFRKRWDFYGNTGWALPLFYCLWCNKEKPAILDFLRDCKSKQLLRYKYLSLLPIKMAEIAFFKVLRKMRIYKP